MSETPKPPPWTYKFNLEAAPLVLAGPILRKVTLESVTVWFALKKPASVVLNVGNDNNFGGHGHTRMIGPNLHIVAVTATALNAEAALSSSWPYHYDAKFMLDDEPVEVPNLHAATNGARLSYFDADDKPMFCTPPDLVEIQKVRIVHGSCRKPHGGGHDALALLDDHLEQKKVSADLDWPHQLMLTGDQIYADDVSAKLLMMVSAAAEMLVGRETMPLDIPGPVDGAALPQSITASAIPPLQRSWFTRPDTGFTSEKSGSHLLSLGEYMCMYLFAWSNELWKIAVEDEPDMEDIANAATSPTDLIPDDTFGKIGLYVKIIRELLGEIDASDNLTRFKDVIWKVRRVLASIPTYMMMNDHDITDNFNMSRDICEKMYATKFGRRVAQNGLLAYTLCQHWGNVPEDFRTNLQGRDEPGLQILKILEEGPPYDDAKGLRLQPLLGIHDTVTLRNRTPFAVFHDDGALVYNYTIEQPLCQVLVADTRTWRSFPAREAAQLLPPAQLEKQIVQAGAPTNGRALFVVLPTNAPPVRALRYGTSNPDLDELYPVNGTRADIHEKWEPATEAYDRLLRAISERLSVVSTGPGPDDSLERRGVVTILSGDVHSGSASRLVFHGSSRFEELAAGATPTKFVVAHLAAGSLKNQDRFTETQHRFGHEYPAEVLGPTAPEGFAGWNPPPGLDLPLCTRTVVDPQTGVVSQVTRTITKSTTLSMKAVERAFVYEIPNYRYRLDYLSTIWKADREHPLPGVYIGKDPTYEGIRASAFQALLASEATQGFDQYAIHKANGRQVVGMSNFGEVIFPSRTSDTSSRIEYKIRWRDPVSGIIAATDFHVSMNPEDSLYPLDIATPPLAPAP